MCKHVLCIRLVEIILMQNEEGDFGLLPQPSPLANAEIENLSEESRERGFPT